MSVVITLVSSSPYRTGLPPSGKLGLGGGESEKQLNTSVMSLWKRKIIHADRSHLWHYPCLPTTSISMLRTILYKDWPGELLEGAESDHSSHALTGWCKRCVKENITHAGHVHHPIVVQVGWERHPMVLTGSNLEWEATTPLKRYCKDVPYSPLRTSQQFWSLSF